MSALKLLVTFVFVDNVALVLLLGWWPPRARRASNAVAVGVSITLLTSVSAVVAWLVRVYVLEPLHLEFLQTVVILMIIAGLPMLLGPLLERLGRTTMLLPELGLLVTNSAVLGAGLMAFRANYTLGESVVFGVSAGAGFLLVLFLLSTIRERLESEWIPRPLRGVPIALVTAGLIALAFLAFDREFVKNLLGA